MHIGHNYRFLYALQQNDITHHLSETVEERDLGVLVTDNLSISTQRAEAAKKAMKVLSMVRQHFKDMDKECFTILYKSFIRPRLEYAIQAWSPYLQRDMDCLEKIQRRATKLVKGMKNLSYGQRLCNLGLIERRPH